MGNYCKCIIRREPQKKVSTFSLLILFDTLSGWVYFIENGCGGGEQVAGYQLSPNNPQGSAGTAVTKVV